LRFVCVSDPAEGQQDVAEVSTALHVVLYLKACDRAPLLPVVTDGNRRSRASHLCRSGTPILALAHEHDPDPEMRPYNKPVSSEQREKLLIGIAAGVMRIYKYFRRPSPQEMPLVSESSTYRRTLPKVGRNEPCPCGSGKNSNIVAVRLHCIELDNTQTTARSRAPQLNWLKALDQCKPRLC
jgi:SEC-C motif